MSKQAWWTVAAAAALMFALPVAVRAGGNETRLGARLAGPAAQPLASGKAKFEARDDRTRLSVQVEDTTGTSEIGVTIGGVAVGTAMIDPKTGRFDLNLDSRDGDNVPSLSAGDVVEVVDTANNNLILTGQLD